MVLEKIFQISDNIHGLISCSQLEKQLISSVPFNRLHYVLQNSTAFKTFPSNQTSRFSHSLGTMHISGKMIISSIMNADSEVIKSLISIIAEETIKIINENSSTIRSLDDKNLQQIVTNCLRSKSLDGLSIQLSDEFYKQLCFPVYKESERFALLILSQSVRCSALLHDIGHPPFSHIVEYALNDLYKDNKGKDKGTTKRKEEFLRILDHYKTDNIDAELHEKIGLMLSERLLEDAFKNSANLDVKDRLFIYLVSKFTQNIMNAKSISEIKGQADEDSRFYSDIHEIISGHLDCDRLDYVVRDASNSGFTKGTIEYDRLIYSSKLQHREYSPELSDKRFIISYDIRCLNTVEDFFRRRWCLYKDLIYHHRVRKTDALLRKLVYKISSEYLLVETSEEKSFDGRSALPMDISGLWKAIDVFFNNEDLFTSTIQWKDNWLISSLEQYYFDKRDGCNNIDGMLNEFLKNEKVYYSRIKRGSDFDIFDNYVRSFLMELDKNRLDIINKLCNTKNEKYFFKQVIVAFFQLNKNTFKKYNISIDSILFESVDHAIKNLGIYDYLFIINKSKNAEQFRVYFHDKDKCDLLEQQSFVQKELVISEISNPYFYLFTTDYNNRSIDSNDRILEEVSKILVEKLGAVIDIIINEEESMKKKRSDESSTLEV